MLRNAWKYLVLEINNLSCPLRINNLFCLRLSMPLGINNPFQILRQRLRDKRIVRRNLVHHILLCRREQ